MQNRLISIDFAAEFGMLKKPDINEGLYLTYNSLHKPALLGIFGAICGMGGFSQSHSSKSNIPEYYVKFGSLPVGIAPLGKNGNFEKTVISYNNSVGYANRESGGNLIISEQTLIKPSYRIFLLTDLDKDDHKKLYTNLEMGNAEYIPYIGKNEFQLWWKQESFREYEFTQEKSCFQAGQIKSLFSKTSAKLVSDNFDYSSFNLFDENVNLTEDFFIYYERLPTGYNDVTTNYDFANFIFTNGKMKREFLIGLKNLFYISDIDYIQLIY